VLRLHDQLWITRWELVRLYRTPRGSVRLDRLRHEARSCPRLTVEPPARAPQRVNQRLGPELSTQIVTEYISGISSTALTRPLRHR